MKLAYLIFLTFAAFSMERINNETSEQKKLEENSKKQFLKSVCCNESSVKLFHDKEANELIFWEDPNELIRNEKKEEIESFLQLEGEARSNALFDCVSNWSPPRETRPFVKELMFVLSETVNVDKRGEKYNETLLMIASALDAESSIVKLIERGAKMEAIDNFGYTALHYATMKGNKVSCEALLQKKANVNAQTFRRSTPLMFGAGMGCTEVVKLLLESGADTGIADNHDLTALDYAKPNCANIIKAHEFSKKQFLVAYDGHFYDGPQLEFYFKVQKIY